MDSDSKQRLVCVGHVCHDIIEGGFELGGSVSFASSIARDHNELVKVVTAFGPDFQFEPTFDEKGIELVNLGSLETTCFENLYNGDDRTQFLRFQGGLLENELVLSEIDREDIVLISPIANEIEPNIISKIECGLLVCTIQGWLRHIDDEQSVQSKPMDWTLLNDADVVILSYEDIEGLGNALEHLRLLDSIVVITNAGQGADVFYQGDMKHYPAIPTTVIDPTGAGDAFAVAYTLEYNKTKDIDGAMSFAHEVASKLIS